jgi:hypothetical protein
MEIPSNLYETGEWVHLNFSAIYVYYSNNKFVFFSTYMPLSKINCVGGQANGSVPNETNKIQN